MLLQHSDINGNLVDEDGYTALNITGNTTPGSDDIDIHSKNSGKMALMLADEAGHEGIVKLVTERKQFLGLHVISFIPCYVNRRVNVRSYR
jgi:hypothetical protein